MQTSINLRPNAEGKELLVEIHGQANAAQDRVIEKLCEELNATETVYPGTDLVLKYQTLRSLSFPRDQDVCRAKLNLESENEYVEQRIAKAAGEKPAESLTSLNNHMDMNWMKEACHRLRRDSAPGVDGITVAEYGRNLEANLQSLIGRVKSGRYVAPPARRVHISKGDGKETRHIGVPTVEDSRAQRDRQSRAAPQG